VDHLATRLSDSTTTAPSRPWWAPGAVAGSYLAAALVASAVADPVHHWALAPVPLLLTVLAGLVGAATIGPLARRLRLPLGPRLAVIALVVYLLATVTNEVEALLFIKGSSVQPLVTGVILTLGLAVPVTLLWPPDSSDGTVRGFLRATLASRPWWSWGWRILLVSLLWVPVYLIFAAADAPFVHIYYHQTGTTFTVPDTGTIALAELCRGLLHALVLGMLAALLALGRRKATWFWLALAFASLNAWLPLMRHSDWPYYLRAANLVEITCDAAVFGGLVALLLTRRRGAAQTPGERYETM
jgi:hypothetical protein